VTGCMATYFYTRVVREQGDGEVSHLHSSINIITMVNLRDRLCGRVVRVPGTDPEVPSSITGATRFSE
jgi:hypothetical protein